MLKETENHTVLDTRLHEGSTYSSLCSCFPWFTHGLLALDEQLLIPYVVRVDWSVLPNDVTWSVPEVSCPLQFPRVAYGVCSSIHVGRKRSLCSDWSYLPMNKCLNLVHTYDAELRFLRLPTI